MMYTIKFASSGGTFNVTKADSALRPIIAYMKDGQFDPRVAYAVVKKMGLSRTTEATMGEAIEIKLLPMWVERSRRGSYLRFILHNPGGLINPEGAIIVETSDGSLQNGPHVCEAAKTIYRKLWGRSIKQLVLLLAEVQGLYCENNFVKSEAWLTNKTKDFAFIKKMTALLSKDMGQQKES